MSENTTPSQPSQGRHLLAEKDFVKVVDAEGNDLPSVPKHWGVDQLAAGAEKKGRTAASSSSTSGTGGSQTPGTRETGQEPPRSGTGSGVAEWVAFAKEKGATDAELLDDDGEALNRDALIAKYGAPASS